MSVAGVTLAEVEYRVITEKCKISKRTQSEGVSYLYSERWYSLFGCCNNHCCKLQAVLDLMHKYGLAPSVLCESNSSCFFSLSQPAAFTAALPFTSNVSAVHPLGVFILQDYTDLY